jgi:hypothetical protein
MLSAEQLAGLEAHLSKEFAFTLILPSDPVAGAARALLSAGLAAIAPEAAAVAGGIVERLARISVTAPTPLGTVVLLSELAMANLTLRARTVAHEATHACQILRHGSVRTAVDYAGSSELRAVREAHACVAGWWTEYLLTGRLPGSAADIVASLSSCLYMLTAEDRALAEGIAASALETMAAGGVPPFDVCVAVLFHLQAHAPDAIDAPAHRITRVPS